MTAPPCSAGAPTASPRSRGAGSRAPPAPYLAALAEPPRALPSRRAGSAVPRHRGALSAGGRPRGAPRRYMDYLVGPPARGVRPARGVGTSAGACSRPLIWPLLHPNAVTRAAAALLNARARGTLEWAKLSPRAQRRLWLLNEDWPYRPPRSYRARRRRGRSQGRRPPASAAPADSGAPRAGTAPRRVRGAAGEVRAQGCPAPAGPCAFPSLMMSRCSLELLRDVLLHRQLLCAFLPERV